MKTYTVFRLRLDGSLECKEHLNNLDELTCWMWEVVGKYASVKITCDQTSESANYTYNGRDWSKINI